ncbi:MAG: universal stress protein [Gammaproteobacteria bacterium]
MFPYKKILVTIDYSENSDVIFKKLETICKNDGIRRNDDVTFILFHVVERDLPTLMGASQNEAISYNREWSLEEIKLKDNAKMQLEKKAKNYKLGRVKYEAEVGVPRMSILFMAKRHNVDLIIVGAHGVHGFKKILGSTAQSILNNATCDVLAVHNK